MTDKKTEALKKAREALQTAHLAVEDDMLADEIQQAITATKEALADHTEQHLEMVEQPLQRKPLTDEEIDKLCPQFEDPMRREMWIVGFKAAHGVKGDA